MVTRQAADRGAAPRPFLGTRQAIQIVIRVFHVAVRVNVVFNQDNVRTFIVGDVDAREINIAI